MDFEHKIKSTGILQMAGKMMGEEGTSATGQAIALLERLRDAEFGKPGWPTVYELKKCIDALKGAAAEKPTGDLTDERALFEAEERKHSSNLTRQADGQYENPCTQSAWEGWQARAA